MFDEALSEAEQSAWQSLNPVVTKFQENHQNTEYLKEVEELLKCFRQLSARMSVKLPFLGSHLDYFPKNCWDLSKEQVELFQQDICIMAECNQGRWHVNFLFDNC